MKKYLLLLLSVLILQNVAFADKDVKGISTLQMESLTSRATQLKAPGSYEAAEATAESNDWVLGGGTYDRDSHPTIYIRYCNIPALWTSGTGIQTITLTQCNVSGTNGSGTGTHSYPSAQAIGACVKAIFVSGTIKDPTVRLSTFYCAEGSESSAAVSGNFTITTVKKSAGSGGTVVVPTPSPT